ncbi:unnamed protein product, partial [Dracunculus medinensis]|uniref:Mitochondrial GTPase 1 n=1 Tax=Dracunculus medinensis TaxID=318479 RepID=A0A0N4UDG8_DRAME
RLVSNAKEIGSSSFTPRANFTLPGRFDYRTWYPMHMSVQLKRMEGKLRGIDLIIEVHDARIPITGRNPQFYSHLYAVRPHILVLNKKDLIDLNIYRKPIEDYYRTNGMHNIVWTDCKRRLNPPLHLLREVMVQSLRDEPRYNRTVKTEYQAMVVGIPNVGKSALINSLRSMNLGRHKIAVKEGNQPGVTVRVQNRVKILDRPPIYLVDTPGVLCPKITNLYESMKLALCNLILESATNPYYVADFLLFWLNKTGDFSYVDTLKLNDGPTDDIRKAMLGLCKSRKIIRKCVIGNELVERWDIDNAAKLFIEMFRKNNFADACLDKDLLLST